MRTHMSPANQRLDRPNPPPHKAGDRRHHTRDPWEDRQADHPRNGRGSSMARLLTTTHLGPEAPAALALHVPLRDVHQASLEQGVHRRVPGLQKALPTSVELEHFIATKRLAFPR